MPVMSEPALDGAVTGEERGAEGTETTLSAAQRARAERQRLRARELRAARLAARPPADAESSGADGGGSRCVVAGMERLLDTGGGFLLPAEQAARSVPRPASPPPAPPPLRADWPACLECEQRFPSSHLLDTFSWAVCDACRDDEERHRLVTRTEAKAEFLLKDCDLDKREPPLRCVRRRNPHRARASDMRLYVRAAVEARAMQVWGGAAALAVEREARDRRRGLQASNKYAQELRALRMEARGALYSRTTDQHEHAWGPESQVHEDTYSRTCSTCDHTQTYEKM